MSSPLAHSLTGTALLLAFAPEKPGRPRLLLTLAAGAVLANMPDVDFLAAVLTSAPRAAVHRTATHSLAAAIAAGLAAGGTLGELLGVSRWRGRALATTAWLSHLVLDLLSADSRPPAGLTLFWPLSSAFVPPWPLLPEVDISRLLAGDSSGLASGLLVELLLGMGLILAALVRRRVAPLSPPTAIR